MKSTRNQKKSKSLVFPSSPLSLQQAIKKDKEIDRDIKLIKAKLSSNYCCLQARKM